MSNLARPTSLLRPRSAVGLAAEAIVLVLVVLFSSQATNPRRRADEQAESPRPGVGQVLGQTPIAFVPNLGQWKHPAQYVASLNGGETVLLEERGWMLAISEQTRDKKNCAGALPRGAAVRFRFVGDAVPELVAEQRLPGHRSYFLGNDPGRWRSEVAVWGGVRYRDLYPGIDMRAYAQDGHLEYDLALAPDADLTQVEFEVDGAEGLGLDPDGCLAVETALGRLRMTPPVSFEESPDGQRRPVASRYVLRAERRVGFEAPTSRSDCSLLLDPGLVWSTLLGGSGRYEGVNRLAIDASGAIVAVGSTEASDFPVTPGAFDPSFNGLSDTFVARISPDGSTLLWATYLGGSSTEEAHGLAVDATGAATVAGFTASTDFPTTPGAFDRTLSGSHDAFVARLSASGSSLIWSTFLGGAGFEFITGLSLDAGGLAIVHGLTDSSDFPITLGAFDTTWNGGLDGFVTAVSPIGSSLAWSTFLGGTGDDRVTGLVLDGSNAPIVVGFTSSSDFPTTPGTFDTSYNGGVDAFVARLQPTATGLAWSTYLGGSGDDNGNAVAIDRDGTIIVIGATTSTDFPTTARAYAQTNARSYDGFVVRLSTTGSSLAWATYLGGDHDDYLHSVAVDADGAVHLTGQTTSGTFPTTPGALERMRPAGTTNCLVTKLAADGASLLWSSYLGGAGDEGANPILVDGGTVVVGGATDSSDFPTTLGALQRTRRGYSDGFLTRLRPEALGIRRFGTSSSGCQGTPAVHALDDARAGSQTFGLACSRAPANGPGILIVGQVDIPGGMNVSGATLWVVPMMVLGVAADAQGEHAIVIPSDMSSRGLTLYAQYAWHDVACSGRPLSASDALEIRVQ